MHRPAQTSKPFISAKAEHLRNEEGKKKAFLDFCTITQCLFKFSRWNIKEIRDL